MQSIYIFHIIVNYTANGKDFGKCITVQRTDIFIEKTCKKCISLQRSVTSKG